MSTTPSLSFRFATTGGGIEIERGAQVDATDWMMIQGVFGAVGRHPARLLELPAADFQRKLPGLLAWPYDDAVWQPEVQDWLRRRLCDHHRLQLARAPQRANVKPLDPLDLPSIQTLKPFQLRNLEAMAAADHGMDFSVPGGGKTRVAWCLFDVRQLQGAVTQMLVLAPEAAFESWRNEAELMYPNPPVIRVFRREDDGDCDVLLCSYAAASRHPEALHAFLQRGPTLLVFDEAHRAKRGSGGRWGATCMALAQAAPYRLVMTGTPAPQGISDLRTMVELAWPGQGDTVLPPHLSKVGQCRSAIEGLYVRTTKTELGIPKLEVVVQRVPMNPLQAEIYRAIRGHIGRNVDSRAQRDLRRMRAVVMHMLMAASNPQLLKRGATRTEPIEFELPPLPLPPDAPLEALMARLSDHEVPAKYEAIARIVHHNAMMGRKTIVWSSFVRNLESLRKLLWKHQPAVVHGAVSVDANGTEPSRQQEIDRFRNSASCRVLLANPQTLGEGVSLHLAAHEAVYLDRTFDACAYMQSVDRIHRLGLGKNATRRVTLLITPETIDEIVAVRVAEKVRQMSRLLDDPGLNDLTMPDEELSPESLNHDDMLALLQHLSGRETPPALRAA